MTLVLEKDKSRFNLSLSRKSVLLNDKIIFEKKTFSIFSAVTKFLLALRFFYYYFF